MRSGTTLMELVVALAVVATLAGVASPSLTSLRDRMEVRAAREELVGLLVATRLEAVARGGARFRVHASPPAAHVLADGVVVRSASIGDPRSALQLELSAGRSAAELAFDGLGLGRFASTTIVVRQGRAEAALVVSSYGRVRRR